MKEYHKAYSVAIGNFSIVLTKDQKKVLEEIKKTDGLIGFKPCYPYGTLILYKTKNDAIKSRNILRAMGVEVGNNIAECEAEYE